MCIERTSYREEWRDDMAKANSSNGFSRTSIQHYSFLAANRSSQAEDFQRKMTEEVAHMRRNDHAVDEPNYFGDVDLHDHTIREPDDSQLLTIEPPLTLSKICSKLTAVERLWVARMVKTHGKDVVLARWRAYEVHINYVRHLR